jgi:hypothetical protein
MATSTQANIIPGGIADSYVASGAIGLGCAVGFPSSTGVVAVVTSGALMGIAANDAADGEIVFVVYSGPAYAKLAGTVTWASNVMLKPTTAGEFIAAAANETSQVRVAPFAGEGASGADNDLIRVVVGVGAVHA